MQEIPVQIDRGSALPLNAGAFISMMHSFVPRNHYRRRVLQPSSMFACLLPSCRLPKYAQCCKIGTFGSLLFMLDGIICLGLWCASVLG